MKTTTVILSALIALSLISCEVIHDQYSPKAMLAKYEWFKNQNESIQQIGARYTSSLSSYSNLREYLGKEKDWQSREEIQRMSSVVQGYQSQYNSLAAEYNAQSSKFNWASFKTSDLPKKVEYK